MEKKQLDFSAPLLSVRRFSDGVNRNIIEKSPPNRQHSLPVQKSDWELGDEVTKPGAVPFLWEWIPGKAKGKRAIPPQHNEEGPSNTPTFAPGRALNTKKHIEEENSGDQTLAPSNTPRLPPGRALDAIKYVSGKKSGVQSVRSSSNPRRPLGRACKKSGEQNVVPSNTLRFAPGRALDAIKHISGKKSGNQSVPRPQQGAPPLNDHATLLDILKDDMNAKRDSDLDSGDDEYSDAPDTLSPTGSFSFNCNVSGLSGYDGPGVKQSGTFSIDPQTRDFLMGRFLPAAKAMVLETPQYVPRKQPTLIEQPAEVKKVNEQPVEVKKVVIRERRPLIEKYGASIMSQYGQSAEDAESEDEDDECDDLHQRSPTACGLLPRLCAKNSLGLLNPVPGIKLRTQAPVSSAGEVQRRTRSAHSGPLDKHGCDSISKKKFHSGVLPQELHGTGNKLIGESKKYSYSGELYMTDGSSPYSRLRSGGISPYRNRAPQSPFQSGARFLGIPKDVGGISPYRNQGPGLVSPAVEKTLYVDSVNNVEIPISNSFSSEPNWPINSSGKNFKALVESKEKEDVSTAKSYNQDMTYLTLFEGESVLEPKEALSLKGDTVASASITCPRFQADRTESLKGDQVLDQESISLNCLEVYPNGTLDTISQGSMETNDQRKNAIDSSQSPLTPPLPKSPSESWLWRTLPSISLRNPFSQSHLSNHFKSKKLGAAGTKWETIVKTSNVHHDHARYSEELIHHVSQHLKS